MITSVSKKQANRLIDELNAQATQRVEEARKMIADVHERVKKHLEPISTLLGKPISLDEILAESNGNGHISVPAPDQKKRGRKKGSKNVVKTPVTVEKPKIGRKVTKTDGRKTKTSNGRKAKVPAIAQPKMSLKKAIYNVLQRKSWPTLKDRPHDAVGLTTAEISDVIEAEGLWSSPSKKDFGNQVVTTVSGFKNENLVERTDNHRYVIKGKKIPKWAK